MDLVPEPPMISKNYSKDILDRNKLRLDQKLILSCLFMSIAAGRWGAWIGIPGTQVFLLDVLLVSGCLVVLPKVIREKGFHFGYVLTLLVFIVFQFWFYKQFDTNDQFRDLAPFLYLSLVPLIAISFKDIDIRSVYVCLRYSTLFNATWSFSVYVGLIAPISVGGPIQVPIFTSRWDHTGIVLAIGLLVWSRFPNLNLNSNKIILIFLAVVLVLQGSRAGLIAGLIATIYIIFKINKQSKFQLAKNLFKLILFVILFSNLQTVSNVFPSGSSIQRVLSPREFDLNLNNTATARLNAQKLLIEHWADSNLLLTGLGAGDQMVRNSYAVQFLSGSDDVRSPHSWPIGLLSRFGIVGFIIWSYLPAKLLFSRRLTGSNMRDVKVLLVMILFASSVGVIIEAPFGSIPFCIFIAILLSRKRSRAQN